MDLSGRLAPESEIGELPFRLLVEAMPVQRKGPPPRQVLPGLNESRKPKAETYLKHQLRNGEAPFLPSQQAPGQRNWTKLSLRPMDSS